MSAKRYIGRTEKINPSLFADTYFSTRINPTDVLKVSNITNNKCVKLRAGDNSTKRNDLCDVSGIFGAVCPHSIPYMFFGKHMYNYKYRYVQGRRFTVRKGDIA